MIVTYVLFNYLSELIAHIVLDITMGSLCYSLSSFLYYAISLKLFELRILKEHELWLG